MKMNIYSFYCYSVLEPSTIEQNTLSNPVLTRSLVLAAICIGGFLFFYIFHNVRQERILTVLHRNSYVQYLISSYQARNYSEEDHFYARFAEATVDKQLPLPVRNKSSLDQASLLHNKAIPQITSQTSQERTGQLLADKLADAKAIADQAVAHTNVVKDLPEISLKIREQALQEIDTQTAKIQAALDQANAAGDRLSDHQVQSIKALLKQVGVAHDRVTQLMTTQEQATLAAVKGAEAGEAVAAKVTAIKPALDQADIAHKAIAQSITAQEQAGEAAVNTQEAYQPLVDQLVPVLAAFDKLVAENRVAGRAVVENVLAQCTAEEELTTQLKEFDQVVVKLVETVLAMVS